MNPASDWPEDLKKAFRKKVDEFWANQENAAAFENPDNHRQWRVGNPEEGAIFKKAADLGCCGEFEVEWELEGVKVVYGFNYGH